MADGDITPSVLEFGRDILHDEARALDALADSLGGDFEQAIGLILDCKGKLIVSGLGKSGHVARKIAATFASTGTTATFLHLAEAIHGDLGMAARGDVALLISQSGETAELEPVIDHFARIGIPIIQGLQHIDPVLAYGFVFYQFSFRRQGHRQAAVSEILRSCERYREKGQDAHEDD